MPLSKGFDDFAVIDFKPISSSRRKCPEQLNLSTGPQRSCTSSVHPERFFPTQTQIIKFVYFLYVFFNVSILLDTRHARFFLNLPYTPCGYWIRSRDTLASDWSDDRTPWLNYWINKLPCDTKESDSAQTFLFVWDNTLLMLSRVINPSLPDQLTLGLNIQNTGINGYTVDAIQSRCSQ